MKIPVEGGREIRKERVRRREGLREVRKAVVISATGSSVNPLWVLPGDIRGNSGSHILHNGLNPVATDSRGHGRQGARFIFALKTDRHFI